MTAIPIDAVNIRCGYCDDICTAREWTAAGSERDTDRCCPSCDSEEVVWQCDRCNDRDADCDDQCHVCLARELIETGDRDFSAAWWSTPGWRDAKRIVEQSTEVT